MKDLFGEALLDYYQGNYTEDIITETTISEEDELPLPYLFRSYQEMPLLEQKALDLATGNVLDVGCGAGSHSLYLQKKGFPVTAIDISRGAVEVSRSRGVKDVRLVELLDVKEEQFDTILLLMNGTGIFKNLSQVAVYLNHLKSLLTKNGKILIDSSDLKYMYDPGEAGGIWVPADKYYGELEFTMKYKGSKSEPFEWLYLDETLFENACKLAGLHFKVVCRGPNCDYLACLSVEEYSLP